VTSTHVRECLDIDEFLGRRACQRKSNDRDDAQADNGQDHNPPSPGLFERSLATRLPRS
jgi:hypothetical protein